MSEWCLVGNIIQDRRYGTGGSELRAGTAHFSPGTKVYCLPALWGDGYEQVVVIGRHRGSKQFCTMVISAAWITNWRARVVYSPEVIRRLHDDLGDFTLDGWKSKADVEEYVRRLQQKSSAAGTGNTDC